MPRHRTSSGGAGPSTPPQAMWLAGAVIGMTIMAMASGAIAMGAGLAIGRSLPAKQRDQ